VRAAYLCGRGVSVGHFFGWFEGAETSSGTGILRFYCAADTTGIAL
jgi:hypothetical protein